MIALDTNVVLRLLINDDATQHLQSKKLFEAASIFISDTVILETAWVLRAAYGFTPENICQSLRQLLGLPAVQVTDANRLEQAIQWHLRGLGFADALHLVGCQHCVALYSFDKRFVKRAEGLTDLTVADPSQFSTDTRSGAGL